MNRLSAVLASSLLLACSSAGCATTKLAEGQNVQYVHEGELGEAKLVDGCTKLGKVKATTLHVGDQKSARNDLKNKAAELGRTHILFDEGPGHAGIANEADVYKCE